MIEALPQQSELEDILRRLIMSKRKEKDYQPNDLDHGFLLLSSSSSSSFLLCQQGIKLKAILCSDI